MNDYERMSRHLQNISVSELEKICSRVGLVAGPGFHLPDNQGDLINGMLAWREENKPRWYQNAICKACLKAKIASWGPNRLRHNAATFLRKQFGIEAARVVLGHTSAAVTEIYAEMDRKRAAEIMGQVG